MGVPEVISGTDTSYRFDSPDMTLDDSGTPFICYFSESNSALHLSSYDGTQFNVETVQDIDNAGQYCSIDMDSRGLPVMTAHDGSARDPVFYFLFEDIWSEKLSIPQPMLRFVHGFKGNQQGKYHGTTTVQEEVLCMRQI